MRRRRLSRLSKLGGMAAGLTADVGRAAARGVTGEQAAGAEFHRRAARRMLDVLGDMRGLPLKAGQMLSYVDEMIPAEHRHHYREALGRLQVHTPPMGWEEVQAVFTEDFEGRSVQEVFSEFDFEPVAAASIGQVYRARLPTGEEVAVKVQYPGVDQALASDLDNAGALAAVMNTIMPRMSIEQFVQAMTAKLEEELDYTLEAGHQRDFRRLWLQDPEIRIPRVHDDFCTRRVFTSAFVRGREWPEMLDAATAEQRSAYGRTLFRFVFTSLFRHGMFNGDPHPGNYLFHDQGRVTFVDFGCTVRYDEEETAAFCELREAVLRDATGSDFQDRIRRAFGLPPDLDAELVEMFADYFHLAFEPVTAPQPYRFDEEYSRRLFSHTVRLKATLNKRIFLQRRAGWDFFAMRDAHVTFLGRILFGLASILTRLGTEGDFRALLEVPSGT